MTPRLLKDRILFGCIFRSAEGRMDLWPKVCGQKFR